jgi:hypothetical protein
MTAPGAPKLEALAPGLHRWTARHPDWHPSGFGSEVACFALADGDDLLLVDPLLPEGKDDLLDDLVKATKNVRVLITIPYHVRSAETIRDRHGATIHGPAQAAKKLAKTTSFTPLTPGGASDGPVNAMAFAIGKPRRAEQPLWLPSHQAIAFGDALVTTPAGELRMWIQEDPTPKRVAWYRDTFAPTFDDLRALPVTRVLTTHGAPIVHDGAAHLANALVKDPWYHRG